MIKVSVIIPVYNAEAYLWRCLDSIVNQTLPEIEIIAVDDGSTDGSVGIITAYQERFPGRIILLRQANSGTGAARNSGIERAGGEYIGFVDADDYVEPGMYGAMYSMAKEMNAELIECNYLKEYKNRVKIIKKIKNYTGDNKLFHTEYSVWNKIVLRETILFHNIRFPVGLNYEDAEFVCKLMPFINTAGFIENPYYHYIQNYNSRYHSFNEKTRDSFTVYDNIVKFYHDNDTYEQYKNQLEYIYLRSRLGASLFRIVRIKDKKLRKRILAENWLDLADHFPGWRKNNYLREDNSLLGRYFKTVNHITYRMYAAVFIVLFRIMPLLKRG
jgi:glycosyltransferase involved in cell wall biosynthesis